MVSKMSRGRSSAEELKIIAMHMHHIVYVHSVMSRYAYLSIYALRADKYPHVYPCFEMLIRQ